LINIAKIFLTKKNISSSSLSKHMILSSIVIFLINIIEYVLNEKKIKKISMFCHVFGGVTGFLVGLVLYNNRSSRNKKFIEVVALVSYLTTFTLLSTIYLLQIRIKRFELGDDLFLFNVTTNSTDFIH
jgi:hypothetical protein